MEDIADAIENGKCVVVGRQSECTGNIDDLKRRYEYCSRWLTS
jgi:hypothetical protein